MKTNPEFAQYGLEIIFNVMEKKKTHKQQKIKSALKNNKASNLLFVHSELVSQKYAEPAKAIRSSFLAAI